MEPKELLQMLWKKESADPNALFIDIFESAGCTKSDQLQPTIEEERRFEEVKQIKLNPDEKCDDAAKSYRMDGNTLFKGNDYTSAIYCYNKSLCHAPIGSMEMGLAYANRSMCFMHLGMHEKCLIDIQLASSVDNMDEMKLNQRRIECTQRMELENRTTKAGENVRTPRMDYMPDVGLPGMANVLQIERNEKFGRHITAKCDIEAGKVVVLEEAFIPQMRSHRSYNCATCFKRGMNFIPCNDCTVAMFCDKDCMAKNAFHGMECKERFLNTHTGVQYFARSVLKAINVFPDIADLMAFVEDAVSGDMSEIPQSLLEEKSKYRAFLKHNISLPQQGNERFYLQEAYTIYTNLSQRRVINAKFNSKKKQRFLMHLATYHYLVMTYSSVLFKADPTDFSCICFMILRTYFNHSCAPNLHCSQYGNRLVGTTVRPIKKGEQIFISYMGPMSDDEETRRAVFHDFKCECEICVPLQRAEDLNTLNENLVLFADVGEYTAERNLKMRILLSKLLNLHGGDGWNDYLKHLIDSFTKHVDMYFDKHW